MMALAQQTACQLLRGVCSLLVLLLLLLLRLVCRQLLQLLCRLAVRRAHTHTHTCSAWMSKMTMLVGPPLLGGMLDRMRASVKAVATSPSVSTYSSTESEQL
jgi:hypothetical protein